MIPPPGAAATIGDDQWRATFESSFLGAVRLARVVAAKLGEDGVVGFLLSPAASYITGTTLAIDGGSLVGF